MWRTVLSLGTLFLAFAAGTVRAEDTPNRNNANNDNNMRGRIVRFDAANNTVVVRTGEGNDAKETQYTVGANTKYWGSDRQAMDNGLRNKNFKEGSDIWYRTGTGDDAKSLSEVRFFDPRVNPNANK